MFSKLRWLFVLMIIVRSSLVQADHQCRPWSFYNNTLQDCQCYETQTLPTHRTHHDFILECSQQRVLINTEYCLTNEMDGTFIGQCRTYLINKNAMIIDGIYIQLPDNITQLNDYMCGSMNRKGRICSECVDGFAPSVTSLGYKCSNCSASSWYGIPLYLFLEFVPITLFYLAVLVFQISVTSSPMTFSVMYSQIGCYCLTLAPFMIVFKSSYEYTSAKILTILHGIWNLDFFRYILPPFCASPFLKNIHILFLGYISAAYPLLLIILTLILVELYSRNLQPFVWLWSKLSCLIAHRKSKINLVDIFATFLFLSYTKLCFISMVIFASAPVYRANSTQSYAVLLIDPRIRYFSREHIPYAVVGALILLIFGLLPALLLAVYPIRKLRSLLLMDRLGGHNAALSIFVEKFYSCYRDGLDGGRDMRSFASLHLFIRLLSTSVFMAAGMYPTIIFSILCLLIVIVRPCKHNYMNYGDAFILALLALNSYQIDKITSNSCYSPLYLWSLLVTAHLPLLIIYGNLIPKKYLMKVKKVAAKLPLCRKFSCLKDEDMQDGELSDNSVLDIDRKMQPCQYPHGAKNGSNESDPLLQSPLNPVYS